MAHVRSLFLPGHRAGDGHPRCGAQWLKLPTPGIPRLADGKPNLAAPAPRTADGKPDFSGLWENQGGDRLYNNIAADLQPGDVAPRARRPLPPAAARVRQGQHGDAVPAARPRVSHDAVPGAAHRADTHADRVRVRRHDAPRDLHGRTGARAGSESDMDGLFGRPLGGRHAGRGEQRLQRSLLARLRRPPAHRGAAHHRALHAPGFRPHRRPRHDGRSQGYFKPITFSMPMQYRADTELLEFICDNRQEPRAHLEDAGRRKLSTSRSRRCRATLASTTSWMPPTARPSQRSHCPAPRCCSTTVGRARKYSSRSHRRNSRGPGRSWISRRRRVALSAS